MTGEIILSVEQYKCLRGHLTAIEKILGSQGKVGSIASERKAPKPKPKETKQQGINRYKMLIETGGRFTKPEYLKK
jgi:hypothetical protein